LDACPEKEVLTFSLPGRRLVLSKAVYAAAILSLFLAGTGLARAAGYWRNTISTAEYRYHVRHINSPLYQHDQGQVPEYSGENVYFPDTTLWKNR
jgi:hypothetical protein